MKTIKFKYLLKHYNDISERINNLKEAIEKLNEERFQEDTKIMKETLITYENLLKEYLEIEYIKVRSDEE